MISRVKLTLAIMKDATIMVPKAQAPKAKINKKNYIKLKSSRTTKETINKRKRQCMNREKISDKT